MLAKDQTRQHTASGGDRKTHPAKSEGPDNTSRFTTSDAAVLDLGRSGVAVHLGELQLGLGADTLGESGVADGVSQSLAIR